MPTPVTIITATYNRAHILRRSLDSVLAQEYANLRLLVIDDGSTDGTAALLDEYASDPRVVIVRHEQNQGVIATRNTALDHLDDDVGYFAFNDSDDLLLPGAVSTAVEAIEAHGAHVAMLFAPAIDAETGAPQGSLARETDEVTFDDYLDDRIHGDWFQLIRRESIGSMRYDPRAGGGEGILWARALRDAPGLVIDQTLQLKDRSGADRVSHLRIEETYAEGQMWTNLYELRTIGNDIRQAYPRRYARLLVSVAHTAAMSGHRQRAMIASRQALRIDPSARTAAVACVALLPAWMVRTITRVLASRH